MPQAVKHVPGLTVFKVTRFQDESWDTTQKQIYRSIEAPNPADSRTSRRRCVHNVAGLIALIAICMAIGIMFTATLVERCGGLG